VKQGDLLIDQSDWVVRHSGVDQRRVKIHLTILGHSHAVAILRDWSDTARNVAILRLRLER